MTATLPSDATLRDLRLSKHEAARFIRSALEVMRKAQRDHGSVSARIGVTGTGVAPNYRIENEDGVALFALNGTNHEPWPDDSPFQGKENWSAISMTFSEVEDLLRALTGYKGK